MTVLLLTALGTLLTALFTGYALVQHAAERPRPRWALSRSSHALPHGDTGRWWMYVTATNIGDGDALAASIVARDGSVDGVNVVGRSPVIASGKELVVAVDIAKRSPAFEDPYGNALDFPINDLAEIGDVRVTITWNHPPYRWLTRKRTYLVRRLEVR